jgi:glycosyltransferase involved in cell wall biosynthesis
MKISIALCTYNGEKYIREQLESILNQTVPPDEIIICDDRSSDSTPAIIRDMQQLNKSILFYVNDDNVGIKRNFESAIERTTGDLIFLSDQDDIWLPNKIELFLAAFKKDPYKKALFSDGYLYVEGKNWEKGLWDALCFKEAQMMQQDKFKLFSYINYLDNVVTGAALAFKKEVKRFILPFPEDAKEMHDYWLCNALSERGLIFPLEEKTFLYRIHPSQQIGVFNVDYYKYLNRVKSRLIYDESTLSISEEFEALWIAYAKCHRIKKKIKPKSQGMFLFEQDLKHKMKNFYARLSLSDRLFYLSRWVTKKALLITDKSFQL